MFNYKLVKIDELITKEAFTHKEEFKAIPIIQKRDPTIEPLLPLDSQVDQEKTIVEISVLSCEVIELITIKEYLLFKVEITFIIQKELVIKRPGLKPLPLEYLFRRTFKKVLKKKRPR